MAEYQCFMTNPRLGLARSDYEGQPPWAPIMVDGLLLDTDGNMIVPEGFDWPSGVVNFFSTEPVEYGDTMDDFRRKVANSIPNMWPQLTAEDVVTPVWMG
jgi:hypothetical protein